MISGLLAMLTFSAYGQGTAISVSLATVDVGQLNKKSMFSYQLSATGQAAGTVSLKGTLKYRNAPHSLSYTLTVPLRPGINDMAEHLERARFEYSSSSVRELFELFDKLPEGMFQYCVQVTGLGGEVLQEVVEDCVFGRNEDIFLINLIDPEDKAKLYERNPMLSWVANYPFASSLSYKIKVVEMKKGQNTVNAIKRNNPVFEEKGLMQMSINYPIYAKPLQVGSTYAWTVDAYYRDLLLGGAEPWQFTIVEDSLLKAVPQHISYYEFEKHQGETRLFAVDSIKLKYESYRTDDSLKFTFLREDGKIVHETKQACVPGTNLIGLHLRDQDKFRHGKMYQARITDQRSRTFIVPFIFIRSELIK